MTSRCSSVDSRTRRGDYPRASVYGGWKRRMHCAYPARRRRCTNATLLCGARNGWQTICGHIHPSEERRPWPSRRFWEQKRQLFPSSPCIASLVCPPLPHHPFMSGVSKNMASYSARDNSEREKMGKKICNHPVGLIEGISDALGVRHSSSFPHWRLYEQVSNGPDLVWQTFSKELLKRGWESDTPTCAFFWGGGASRIRSPLTRLLFNHCHRSLSLSLSRLLWQVSCGPLNCTRNGGKPRKKIRYKEGTLSRALSKIKSRHVAKVQ